MQKEPLPNIVYIGGWGFGSSIWQPLTSILPTHNAKYYNWHQIPLLQKKYFPHPTNKTTTATSCASNEEENNEEENFFKKKPLVVAWSLGAFLFAEKLINAPQIKKNFSGAILLCIRNKFCEDATTKASLRAMKIACRTEKSGKAMLINFANMANAVNMATPHNKNSATYAHYAQKQKNLYSHLVPFISNKQTLIDGLEILETIQLTKAVEKFSKNSSVKEKSQEKSQEKIPTNPIATKSTNAINKQSTNAINKQSMNSLANNADNNFQLITINAKNDAIMQSSTAKNKPVKTSKKYNEEILWQRLIKNENAANLLLEGGHLLPIHASNEIANQIKRRNFMATPGKKQKRCQSFIGRRSSITNTR